MLLLLDRLAEADGCRWIPLASVLNVDDMRRRRGRGELNRRSSNMLSRIGILGQMFAMQRLVTVRLCSRGLSEKFWRERGQTRTFSGVVPASLASWSSSSSCSSSSSRSSSLR